MDIPGRRARGAARTKVALGPLSAVVAAALVVGLFAGPSAGAAAQTIDLRDRDPAIVGAVAVTRAGDVNGDGIPDVLAMEAPEAGGANQGVVHVVFGGAGDGPSDVDGGLFAGFSIYGAAPGDMAFEASAAGDVNGDGLDDVVVGAPRAGFGREASGFAYVVFGKATQAPVFLSVMHVMGSSHEGFAIEGPESVALLGDSVSGAGDMNGDGFADVIVCAPFVGESYVIYGSSDNESVDALQLREDGAGRRGFLISTPLVNSSSGMRYSVRGVGDMNGDQLGDVAIGILKNRQPSRAYVVLGLGERSEPVVTSRLGQQGFVVWNVGPSLSGVGDVDGDGLDDLVAYGLDFKTYVIWGSVRRTNVDARALGRAGYAMVGAGPAGSSALGGGGDWNRDGHSDVILGFHEAGFSGRKDAGKAFIVPGRETSTVVSLRTDAKVLVIGGAEASDYAGRSVAYVGDFDADGAGDWAISSLSGGTGNIYLVSRR